MLSTSTEQLLNTGRGHQAPRKAAHSFGKEVGQNIKDKKRDKTVRDRDPSWGGSDEGGEASEQQEALSLVDLWGALESQRATGEKNKNNTYLTATPSGEVAQTLMSATSKWG